MAEEHAEESRTESEPSNGHHLGRAAMIAAASGATAYAAKKALSSRSSTEGSGEDKSKAKSSGDGSAALVTAAVASGWDVAKDSLIPVVEDAAAKAGAFVAERAPDVVRDVVIPRFIAGFERGRRESEKSES
jgi:hypothetical protein